MEPLESLPPGERLNLAEQLRSADSHLARYVSGSAKDANGEMAAAELVIERVIDRLDPPDEGSGYGD